MNDEFELVSVDHLDCRLEQKVWDFTATYAADIDANWTQVTAARPATYNGQVFLQHHSDLVLDAGCSTYRSHYLQTDYKSFLGWRDLGRPGAQIRNCFAMAALLSADGAFIVGEMGAHTTNAGKVYFAAGTPEPADLYGDVIDLDASARRELEEETGVKPDDVRFESGWTLVQGSYQVACMKRVRSPLGTEQLIRGIERFLASQAQPELARVHAVRSMADLSGMNAPAFMPVYLEWALALLQPG